MIIPATPETLTADWLTQALRKGGTIREGVIRSFTAAPLAYNKGFYGQLSRISLVYDPAEAGAPPSLIAKFSSASPAMRQQALPSYAREVCFYQQLAGQTPLPTPTCYYADIDLESGLHVLLLEDLAPACSGSRIDGCTLEQARIAVQQIANFHAIWWDSPQLDELHWLGAPETKVDAVANRREYEQWWPLFLAQAQDHLPDQIRTIGERLGAYRATIRSHIFGGRPRTLIHRDYQLDNLIFGTTEGGVPFAVVDWQFLSRGCGAWDVAYFVSESLQTEDRRAGERQIWVEYYQLLLDHNIRGYTFEQCQRDYRIALLQRFTALVSTLAVMPISEEQRRIHLDILLPRNIAAILDHHAGAVITE